MSVEIFLAVLGAAALHATWNAIVKGGGDPLQAAAWTAFSGAGASLPVALWLGLPAPESYPFVVLSAVVHIFYFAGMGFAYRAIDLGVAYPLMRGGAPLITALLGTVVLGEALAPVAWAGVLLICGGIVTLGLHAFLKRGLTAPQGAIVAFMIAVIVCYTLGDGVGARRSGQPVAYLLWCNILTALLFVPVYAAINRAPVATAFRLYARRGLLAGVLSAVAYGTALWAMTRAPIGLVAALRETSVLFAMLIGAVVLKEVWSATRIGAAATIVAGLAVLRLA